RRRSVSRSVRVSILYMMYSRHKLDKIGLLHYRASMVVRRKKAAAPAPPPNHRLEDAITSLIQSQAASLTHQTSLFQQLADLERQSADGFARTEALLLDHSRILAEHTRLLQALPQAIREQIAFRAVQP